MNVPLPPSRSSSEEDLTILRERPPQSEEIARDQLLEVLGELRSPLSRVPRRSTTFGSGRYVPRDPTPCLPAFSLPKLETAISETSVDSDPQKLGRGPTSEPQTEPISEEDSLILYGEQKSPPGEPTIPLEDLTKDNAIVASGMTMSSAPYIFAPVEVFRGDGSIARWIERVIIANSAALGTDITAGDRNVSACRIIKAIDALLDGPAADFVDGNESLRAIVQRAKEDAATASDLKEYRESLTEEYPSKASTKVVSSLEHPPLQQGPEETTEEYHKRVNTIVKQEGARDRPANNVNPLSRIEEGYVLKITREIVQGIRDPELQREAISLGALKPKQASIADTFNAISEAERMLEARKTIERANVDRGLLDAFEKIILEKTGQDARQLLVDEYHVDPSLLERDDRAVYALNTALTGRGVTWNIPLRPAKAPAPAPVPAQPAPILKKRTQSPPPPPEYSHGLPPYYNNGQPYTNGNNTGYNGNPGYIDYNNGYSNGYNNGYNNNYGNGGYNHDGSSNDARNHNDFRGRGGRGGRGGGRAGTTRRDWGAVNPALPKLPFDRAASKNAYVNGSCAIPTNQPVCFRCGVAGHMSPQCSTPRASHLQNWESAIIRTLCLPPRDGEMPPPGTLDMKLAQLYFQGILQNVEEGSDAAPSAGTPDAPPTPTVGAKLVSLTRGADVDPFETAWDNAAAPPPCEALPRVAVDAKTLAVPARLADDDAANDAEDEDDELYNAMENIFGEGVSWEQVARKMIGAMALAAAGPPKKKRKAPGGDAVDVDHPSDDGKAPAPPPHKTPPHTASPAPAAPVTEKTRARTNGLAEIRAREGAPEIGSARK